MKRIVLAATAAIILMFAMSGNASAHHPKSDPQPSNGQDCSNGNPWGGNHDHCQPEVSPSPTHSPTPSATPSASVSPTPKPVPTPEPTPSFVPSPPVTSPTPTSTPVGSATPPVVVATPTPIATLVPTPIESTPFPTPEITLPPTDSDMSFSFMPGDKQTTLILCILAAVGALLFLDLIFRRKT